MNQTTKKFNLNEYVEMKQCRPETIAFLKSIEGHEMDQATYVARYKKLGLPRTSPSKGRNMFNYLVKVGFIRSNNR